MVHSVAHAKALCYASRRQVRDKIKSITAAKPFTIDLASKGKASSAFECHAAPCHAMPCCAMSCSAMLCYAMLRCAMLC